MHLFATYSVLLATKTGFALFHKKKNEIPKCNINRIKLERKYPYLNNNTMFQKLYL